MAEFVATDVMAVDAHAVGTAQVGDDERVVVEGDLGVTSADVGIIDDDVAFTETSNDDRLWTQDDSLSVLQDEGARRDSGRVFSVGADKAETSGSFTDSHGEFDPDWTKEVVTPIAGVFTSNLGEFSLKSFADLCQSGVIVVG